MRLDSDRGGPRSWRLSALARRAFGGVRAQPRVRLALLGLLLIGGGLRLWLTYSYRPAFLGFPDARAYIAAVNSPLFWNPYRPAGYPLFLRLLHGLSAHLTVATVVQHVLGMATAVLLYLAVARFVRLRWAALLPAAIVLFSGSQIWLEHSALSDAPFGFLVAAALWCASRTIDGPVINWAWLACAGGLLAAGATTRAVGAFLLLVLIGWGLARRWTSWRPRILAGVVPVAGAVVVLLPYLLVQHHATGQWGLTRTTGEFLYGRVATFADCRRFTPPRGTAQLCQTIPPSVRPNANWYLFDPASPALRSYGTPGPSNPFDTDRAHYRWRGEKPLGEFATAAALHEPLTYLRTTLQGLVKYVAPHAGPRNLLDLDQSTLVHQLHNRAIETDADKYVVLAYHTRPGYVRRDLAALDAYAVRARVEGPLTAVLVVLMLAGWILARGRERTAAGLFGWTTVCMAVAPVALLFYSARYATPMYGPLAASAAIGLDLLTRRYGNA
jgi:4-amino-4-deoxy-L-arabinose transferase-like glycosyltransferase